jgi:hypothetical protein
MLAAVPIREFLYGRTECPCLSSPDLTSGMQKGFDHMGREAKVKRERKAAAAKKAAAVQERNARIVANGHADHCAIWSTPWTVKVGRRVCNCQGGPNAAS